MSSEVDMNGSPTDRSKRPRREDEDWDSDYERDGQDDRHPKRQAVPDPETKAPHFVGAADNDENDKNKAASRSRRKKWEEGSQDSDDEELQILLDDKPSSVPTSAAATTADTNNNNNTSTSPSAQASASALTTTPSVITAAPTNNMLGPDNELVPTPSNEISISLRSLVSTKDAGVIIGRGGKNVSDIREISTARVTISDIVPGAYERILTVTGPVKAVAKVKDGKRWDGMETAIHIICNQAYSLVAEKILSEMPPPDDGQEQSLTIRLLIADNRMGTLIGRGGSVIRSIQEQSHARVNASEEPLPMSTERTVTIVGTTAAVQGAIYQIAEILAEHPERVGGNNTIPYRPQPQGVGARGGGYGSMPRTSSVAGGAGGGGSGPAAAVAAAAMNPYGAMMGHMGGMPMGSTNPQLYYQAAAAAAYGAMPGVASGRQGDYGNMGGMMANPQAQQIFIPNEMV